jgi:hypothetical protein
MTGTGAEYWPSQELRRKPIIALARMLRLAGVLIQISHWDTTAATFMAICIMLEFRQRLPNLTRGQVGDFSVIQSYLNGLCGGFCR